MGISVFFLSFASVYIQKWKTYDLIKSRLQKIRSDRQSNGGEEAQLLIE